MKKICWFTGTPLQTVKLDLPDSSQSVGSAAPCWQVQSKTSERSTNRSAKLAIRLLRMPCMPLDWRRRPSRVEAVIGDQSAQNEAKIGTKKEQGVNYVWNGVSICSSKWELGCKMKRRALETQYQRPKMQPMENEAMRIEYSKGNAHISLIPMLHYKFRKNLASWIVDISRFSALFPASLAAQRNIPRNFLSPSGKEKLRNEIRHLLHRKNARAWGCHRRIILCSYLQCILRKRMRPFAA